MYAPRFCSRNALCLPLADKFAFRLRDIAQKLQYNVRNQRSCQIAALPGVQQRHRVILSGIHEYYEPEELVGKTLVAITNLPPRPMMGIESCGMLLSAVHHENGEDRLHLLMVDPHIPAGAKLY